MVEGSDNIIGFGLMVKGVDFDPSFHNCGSLKSFKCLILAFGQYYSSNSTKEKDIVKNNSVSVFLLLEGM